MPVKIVSGGQTGVDRAALDAGMAAGIETGGWCPERRLAEDGVISRRYKLTELPGGGYRERTLQNVLDSDATAIICPGEPTGGTRLTLDYCKRNKKPFILIDSELLNVQRAGQRLTKFVRDKKIETLNVAGPRASGCEGIYEYARNVISYFCQSVAH